MDSGKGVVRAATINPEGSKNNTFIIKNDLFKLLDSIPS